MNVIRLERVVVVEGKYDKIKLDSLLDATILTTDGFEIFKDKEKQNLLRTLAQKKGLIVLTDSDKAGFQIRNFLGNICGKKNIINAYIPDLYGKERRKVKPSKEGKLGVEGVRPEVIADALAKAGALCEITTQKENVQQITKLDFYEDGLSGGEESRIRRQALIARMGLPEHLSANSLLTVLNVMLTFEEYKAML